MKPREVPNWNEYFFKFCADVAARSKDPSNQFGAVIVGPEREVRSTGYNGFPRGVQDNLIFKQDRGRLTGEDVLARWERPIKYQFVVHAELNAILNAARSGASLLGCVMYINGHPCHECAKAIIQSGIEHVFYRNPSSDYMDRWKESIKIAQTMFQEANVRVSEI